MNDILFCLCSALLAFSSCNMRGDNPTTGQMMARADSIDSLANVIRVSVDRAESARLADSAMAAAEYEKYHLSDSLVPDY